MTASNAERKLQELSFLHEIARLASSARDWDEMLRIVIDRTTDAIQAAGIIAKGRLQREAERKLHEVSALFEVSNVLTSTLDLDEVLALVVDRLVRVYPGASGAIFLRDQDETRERARSGQLGRSAVQAAQRAIGERRPIVAFDHIAIPLVANDRLLGAVVLQVPDYKEFLEEEVRFVGALANQAALAIDKASLYLLERKTTENLRELERARGEFVAVVTHDLRTPLSVIRGYLDQLAEKNGKSAIPVGEAIARGSSSPTREVRHTRTSQARASASTHRAASSRGRVAICGSRTRPAARSSRSACRSRAAPPSRRVDERPRRRRRALPRRNDRVAARRGGIRDRDRVRRRDGAPPPCRGIARSRDPRPGPAEALRR